MIDLGFNPNTFNKRHLTDCYSSIYIIIPIHTAFEKLFEGHKYNQSTSLNVFIHQELFEGQSMITNDFDV